MSAVVASHIATRRARRAAPRRATRASDDMTVARDADARPRARAATESLKRAQEAIWEILASADSSDDDDASSDAPDESIARERSTFDIASPAGAAREGAREAGTGTPVGARLDAAALALERRRAEALDAAASDERAAAMELREAREALERAQTTGRGLEALERAVAERDLEIFKRDDELRALREEVGRLRTREDDAGETMMVSASIADANTRAANAEEGARAMREALKDAETKNARERAALMDQLRESRALAAKHAREAHAREEANASSSGRIDEVVFMRKELDAMAKKVSIAEAVAEKLERIVAQKSEEVFNATQERDALRKKLKTTSETIDSLEREWLEFNRQGLSAQKALSAENEELHKIVDDLKSAEKDGFAEAAGEIEELKARLRTFESESGVSNRSVDRNLARESITSLRSKVRELKGDIEAKDAQIEDLRNALSQKSIIEAVNAEKDAVITALQAQINASNSAAPRSDSEFAVSTQNAGDIDVLDELQTVAKTLRRENAALRRELEDVDPDVLEECIALSRRVTAQHSLLASYEERLVRYTDQLGIPFTPEARP